MTAETTYNGWKNYPTWAVNLWLSNDEGLYLTTLEQVREIVSEDEPTSRYWSLEESHRFNTADMLKDFAQELCSNEYDGSSMLSDLIGFALGEVDWNEIAESWIESARDE